MNIIKRIKCKLSKHDFDIPYILQNVNDNFLEVYQKCLSCPRGRHFRVACKKEFTQSDNTDFCYSWIWNPMYDNDPCMKEFLDHYKKLDLI